MVTIVYVSNTTLDADGFRTVDVVRLGVDAQTPDEASPWGVDSNPVNDIGAVFSESVEKGSPVCLGYFIRDKKAARGETRLFATNSAGVEQTRIWLHADGTVELGGTGDAGTNANHATQFEALKTAFDELKSDFNDLVTKYNAHVHPGVTSGGSSTAVTATQGTSSAADVSGAKLTKIKVE